jgi:acetylcholinesterase
MVTNGGNNEGLFRGAFMESGAVIPAGDISLAQPSYDALVQDTGCAGAQDTLGCLRQVPLSTLQTAMNNSPWDLSYRVCHDFLDPLSSVMNHVLQALNLAWGPRADGAFLKAPPQQLVLQGSIAKVPFVIGNKQIYSSLPAMINLASPGNCDDEGTLFSLPSLNVT